MYRKFNMESVQDFYDLFCTRVSMDTQCMHRSTVVVFSNQENEGLQSTEYRSTPEYGPTVDPSLQNTLRIRPLELSRVPCNAHVNLYHVEIFTASCARKDA
jgi:hypothetical protein